MLRGRPAAKSFDLERRKAAHDGRAWQVPAINMLSFF
jgi:hypothetical protein